MSDLVGNPEDRFSGVAAQMCYTALDMSSKAHKEILHCIHVTTCMMKCHPFPLFKVF